MRFTNRLSDFCATTFPAGRPSYAFDLIRIFLGLILTLKGFSFLSNRGYLAELMGSGTPGWFWELAIVHYVIIAHIGGGIGMISGFLTRISALIQIPVLLGAIFLIHLPRITVWEESLNEVQHLEHAVLFLFLMTLVALRGAGNWSFDHLVFDGEKHLTASQSPT